jgi:hypothetical protein
MEDVTPDSAETQRLLQQVEAGDRAEAEKMQRQALDRITKLTTDFPATPDDRQHLAHGHGRLANLLKQGGNRAEAAKHFHQAIDLYGLLVTVLYSLDQLAEAEEAGRQAAAQREKLVTDFPQVPGTSSCWQRASITSALC